MVVSLQARGKGAPGWATVVLVPRIELEGMANWEVAVPNVTVSNARGVQGGGIISLTNTGEVDLTFRVLGHPGWLNIPPSALIATSLPSGVSVTLETSVNGTGIEHAMFKGTLTLEIKDDGYIGCLVDSVQSVNVAFDNTFDPEEEARIEEEEARKMELIAISIVGVIALVMFAAAVKWVSAHQICKPSSGSPLL